MESKSLTTLNEDKNSDLTHKTSENRIKFSQEDQSSSTVISDKTKSCGVECKDEANVTSIPNIKTSQKDKSSSTVTSTASKSCDVEYDDAADVVIIPKIKAHPKDYPSSLTDSSKKPCQDVKDEKKVDDTSDAVVTNIPKSEEKLIKNDPTLYQVRLQYITCLVFKILNIFLSEKKKLC